MVTASRGEVKKITTKGSGWHAGLVVMKGDLAGYREKKGSNIYNSMRKYAADTRQNRGYFSKNSISRVLSSPSVRA